MTDIRLSDLVLNATGGPGGPNTIAGRGFTGSAGVPGKVALVSEVSTNYVLTDNDLAGGVLLRVSSSSDRTITVNSGLTGTEPITVIRKGTGNVSFVAGSGVTINSAGGYSALRVQYSSATLIPEGSNVYVLIGDLGP